VVHNKNFTSGLKWSSCLLVFISVPWKACVGKLVSSTTVLKGRTSKRWCCCPWRGLRVALQIPWDGCEHCLLSWHAAERRSFQMLNRCQHHLPESQAKSIPSLINYSVWSILLWQHKWPKTLPLPRKSIWKAGWSSRDWIPDLTGTKRLGFLEWSHHSLPGKSVILCLRMVFFEYLLFFWESRTWSYSSRGYLNDLSLIKSLGTESLTNFLGEQHFSTALCWEELGHICETSSGNNPWKVNPGFLRTLSHVILPFADFVLCYFTIISLTMTMIL
jgi:hypothetical protein